VSVGAADDVSRALKDVGLPAVVKPSESWLGAEGQGTRVVSRLVTTPEEAVRAVSEHTRFGGVTLFQPFIPGRREAVSFLYANGEVYARFAQWAKRTNPPLGGDSVLRQSIAVPADTGDQAERLVRELDLEGYSEVEFRRDNGGVPYLMEINPRLSASVEMAVRSGVDFPYLLYQWASGGPVDTVDRYRVGNWMRYLAGDLWTTIAALRQRGRPGAAPPAAAHLLWRGLRARVFGKPLEFWRRNMPRGMLLRSHWWATNLSDPRKQYGFGRFLNASTYERGYPLPVEAFIDYAQWFKDRAVPHVDETYVASIEHQRDHFRLRL